MMHFFLREEGWKVSYSYFLVLGDLVTSSEPRLCCEVKSSLHRRNSFEVRGTGARAYKVSKMV